MTALAMRWLWVSLTTSVVLLPLLLGKPYIFRRYRAKTCYFLWLILALRLICPVELPLPALPQKVVTVELPQTIVSEQIIPVTPDLQLWQLTPPALTPQKAGLSAVELATLIWAAGIALTLCWQVGRYLVVSRRLRKNSVRDEAACDLVVQLGGHIPVLRGEVPGPMTLGLLHPVILLPAEGASGMVLRHELCHIRRGDLWYKCLFLLCACLHWYNPLVWWLARGAGELVELCCDEDVVAGEDGEFRRDYGQALLRQAAGGNRANWAASFGSGDLKGRLMNLFMKKKRGTALILAATCGLLMMGSLVGCEVSAANADTEQSVPGSVSTAEPMDTEQVLPDLPEEWTWPVEEGYTLSALYGNRVHPVTGLDLTHDGVDILADEGAEVLVVAPGTVRKAAFDNEKGNYVLVEHHDGTQTCYAQLKESKVCVGDKVCQGQVIGLVGRTGAATGPHLHFGVQDCDGTHKDPLSCYPGMEDCVQEYCPTAEDCPEVEDCPTPAKIQTTHHNTNQHHNGKHH